MRGKRIENRSGEETRVTSDAAKMSTLVVAACIAVPILILCFIVVDVTGRHSGRKKSEKEK